MKKLFILLTLSIISLSCFPVTTVIDKQGNIVEVMEKKDSLTGKYYITSDKKKYPIYKSKRGKLYIIRVSKNSGKEYKYYLPSEYYTAISIK